MRTVKWVIVCIAHKITGRHTRVPEYQHCITCGAL